MARRKHYTLTIHIDAKDATAANALREEIIGAIEDTAESGEIDASAVVDAVVEEQK